MQAPVIHIEIDDNGQPRTINKGVKVHILADKHLQGVPVIDLATHYDISLADIHAALAYYYDNRSYFDTREQAIQPLADTARAKTAKLRQKIEQRLQESSD